MFIAFLEAFKRNNSVTPKTIRYQTVYYILCNLDEFAERLCPSWYPADEREYLYDYLLGILDEEVWGDTNLFAVWAKMFNVSITLVSPCFDKPQKFFHNSNKPDVVIVSNGGVERKKDTKKNKKGKKEEEEEEEEEEEMTSSTHFIATSKLIFFFSKLIINF